ncbi:MULTISPECIES: winged helix-turn-helix domain-containing protein [unclassified Streptomyces]|uniref:winged helix-turn-helix domain-containing protein n=1 Tax=unclassified Streptomyces TaxID=2593676 RepID=UPI003812ACDA
MDRHIQEPPHRHQDAYAVVVADSVDDIGQLNELLDSNLPVLLVRDLRQASRLMDGEETGAKAPRPAPLQVSHLEIRPDEQRALWHGAPLELTAQEIGLLGCLARHGGSVASFQELVQDVWGASCGVDTTVIHSAVRRLRRKLEGAGVDVGIESVRGYGLRITAQELQPSAN